MDKYNFISEEFYKKISKNNELEKGDILYSRVGAGFGNAAIFNLSGRYGVYVSLTHIRPNNSLNNHYLKYYLNSAKGRKQAENGVVQGGGVPNLNVKVVEKFNIPLTSIEEQTKIANFLTAVDEKIAQLSQKCELLAQFKKGVMQQIFSQELRFKDDKGQDFPEWEEKAFNHFLSLPVRERPLTVSRSKLLSVKMHMNGVVQNENTGTLSLGANYFIRKSGQFIYGKQNVFNGAFGLVPKELNGYLSSTDVPSLDIDQNIINPAYFLYYIGRREYYTNLESIASGSGSKRVHEEKFMSIRINLPSLREQIKIANFLTAIDDKLRHTQDQLAAAKQYKQGLLQQMFV